MQCGSHTMQISNLNFTLTRPAKIPIVEPMKWKAALVLLAVLAGIVVPPSLPLLTAAGVEASLGTLDVCHSAAPALFAHGDMPCVNECLCRPLPLASVIAPAPVSPDFKPLLIPFQDERPPRS